MRRNSFIGISTASLLALSAAIGGSLASIIPTKQLAIVPAVPVISKPTKRRRSTTLHSTNGKREVARRLRQIAAGQLTRSNGLVTAEELYGRAAA